MQKAAHLTLKRKKEQFPVVKVGDNVTPGKPIFTTQTEEITKYNLAKALKTKPASVFRYLKVTPGSEVTNGQILAQKGGMLSQHIVRAPITGTLTISDREKGIIGIQKTPLGGSLTAYFSGKVTEMDEEKLVFEVMGTALPAISGKGPHIAGRLQFLPDTSLLHLSTDIENCVIVVEEANPAFIAKADTLGAVAQIAGNIEEPPFTLPYLTFEKVAALSTYDGRMVLVMGDEKTLLILDETEKSPKK